MTARVLVVDDDETIRRTLRINLRARGYEVEVVGDGRSALDAHAAQPPDVAILDLGLPDLDGIEVLRQASVDFLTHIGTDDYGRRIAEYVAAGHSHSDVAVICRNASTARVTAGELRAAGTPTATRYTTKVRST